MPSTNAKRYIVVFHDDVNLNSIRNRQQDIQSNGGVITNIYDPLILNGFAAVIPDKYLAQFQNNFYSDIKYIEEDSIVTIQ